jgi:Ca2+/H+ antiporter
MTAKEHNKLIGIFLMIHGALQTLLVVFMVLIYGGLGAAMVVGGRQQEEQMVGAVFIGVMIIILFFSLLFILPQLLGGWKMLKENPKARNWGIVASIVALLSFPFGTAAGVYGLWFLFGEEGKQFYLDGVRQQNMFNPPPSPQNWQ